MILACSFTSQSNLPQVVSRRGYRIQFFRSPGVLRGYRCGNQNVLIRHHAIDEPHDYRPSISVFAAVCCLTQISYFGITIFFLYFIYWLAQSTSLGQRPVSRRPRKVVAKISNIFTREPVYSYILITNRGSLHTKNFSVYASLSLSTDQPKMTFGARKDYGAFGKRAPGSEVPSELPYAS